MINQSECSKSIKQLQALHSCWTSIVKFAKYVDQASINATVCLVKLHCQHTLVCPCMLRLAVGFVQDLFKLGLSISHDRVLSVSTDSGNNVCHQYEQDGIVCPANMHKGLFTATAVDNII